MPRKSVRATEHAVYGNEIRTLEGTEVFYEDQLRRKDRELVVTREENVRLARALEDSEIERGQLETDLVAERNSKSADRSDPSGWFNSGFMSGFMGGRGEDQSREVDATRVENAQLKQRIASLESSNMQQTDLDDVRKENAQLKRRIASLTSEEPDDGSLAEADLKRVAKRRQLALPDPKYRTDVRGFWQYEECRLRWGNEDPKDYSDLVRWFRGKNDKKGTPSGGQFWRDMLVTFGHDPANYDDIPKNHPLKLHVEHMFCQNLCGEGSSLKNSMMNLFALEAGFNMAIEFKESNTRAKLAFFGARTERNHRAYIRWRDTKDNRNLPSMYFLRSVHCVDQELCASRFMSGGLRYTGRTRQLRLPLVQRPKDEEPRIVEVE